MPDKEKMSRKEVAKLLGVTPLTLWRYVKAGKFPQPKKAINNYSVYWLKSDVDAFLKKRGL